MLVPDHFARQALIHAPTPLERLPGLVKKVGLPELFIKRDDCTGLACGGNKSRKLEFVLADALRGGADTIITTGAIQSNHARQTAAACAMLGLNCELVLVNRGSANAAAAPSGNLLLDMIFGAKIYLVGEDTDIEAGLEKASAATEARGSSPYVVPLGASTAIGALGYVSCAAEIVAQLKTLDRQPTHVFVAAGSGGTQAGLIAGFQAMNLPDVRVIGIDIDANAERTRSRVARLVSDVRSLLGLSERKSAEILVDGSYAGPAYGEETADGNKAIFELARSDGILLDPVYTGKAMAGMIDIAFKTPELKRACVVFVHTGGLPMLLSGYHPKLLSAIDQRTASQP